MKNIKFYKVALATGNCFYITIAIYFCIKYGVNSDQLPATLFISALLSLPLILLIVYGRKVYHQINDKDSNIAILAVSALVNFAHFLIIYYFLRFRKIVPSEFQFIDFSILLPFVGFSILMLLLWVFNVIVYLNRGKWMNK
ncbi:hypothetical protein SAMN05421813_103181 [Daejeonella rubra]|uniref:Uncharacterized protein n=1 Tax=Daejeonella rubra TaxID=990371 RepID=A0A1G9NUE4_9SPHI|nr:hypothetical protein SAMN05421813_103181 [Daejeonella rubra]